MAIIKPEQLSSGTYSISGSFSGSFHGDGSDLNNLPQEILKYSSSINFPQPSGSTNYLYLDQSANNLYSWDTTVSQYVILNNSTVPSPSGSPEGTLYFADLATSARLAPNTYDNGISGSGATLTATSSGVLGQFNQPGKIDNITPIASDIILVKNELTASRNGLYSITNLGSPSSSYVLTRVSYYDTGSEIYPSQITVLKGTTAANQTYIQQTDNPTVGSSSIVFSQSPSTATQTIPVTFMDTVTTGPLPSSSYATGSSYTGFPGYQATITSTTTGSLGVIGGITASSNIRILVVSQSNSVQNGSYTVTSPGSSTTPWRLTRIDYWTSMQPNFKEFVISRFGATEYGSRYVLQSSSIIPANIGISQSLIFQKYLSPSSGSGGSAFPFTGSALITGSLGITGSFDILAPPIVNNTAVYAGFRMADVPGAFFQLTNYSTSSGAFIPTIRSFHPPTGTGTGLQLIAQIGNDGAANVNPAMTFNVMSQSAAVGQIRNRPLFTWENNNTSSMALTTVGLAIGSNLLTPSASLHINNTSSFNSFLVEDDTRPDASPFVINNVGRVGIGNTTPSASLDIKASSSAAIDTVFRITNAANTSSILSIAGNGAFTYNAGTGSITFIEGSSAGVGQRFILQRSTYSASFTIGNNGGTTLATDGLNITSNGSVIELNGGPSGGSFFQSVDLKGNSNLSARVNSTGQFAFTSDTSWYNGANGFTYTGDKVIIDGQTMAFRSASVAPTSTLDTFKLYSADIVAGNAAPHFRTEAGNVVKLYTQAAVTSSQGIADALTNLGLLTGSSIIVTTPTSGPFGIANSSGSYTYYNTLSSSMAAASSGQTIEVFADYTESAGSSVTLKNGVNINGNGHTYIGTGGFAGRWLFQTGDGVTLSCSIINYNITLTQGSPGSCLYLGTNTSGVITLTGTVLKATGSSAINCLTNNTANSNFEIIDFVGFCSTNQSCISWGSSSSGKLRNAYASATTGSGYIGNVRVDNSIFTSVSGIGLYNSGGIVSDSIGTSAGSYGIQTIGGFLNNSKGYSSGGVGIYVLYSNAYNCFGYSTSTYGMQFDNEPCRGYNCFGYSTANNGIRMYRFGIGADVEIYNSTAISTAATAFYWEGFASNMTCISEYNNVNGHAAEGANNAIIANSTLNVKHTGSNCLFKSTPVTQKYTQCTFKTATTPVNANITQGMINTQDNQGNIII